MSLILRKAAQEVLNKEGLTSFHVGISKYKNLTINTKCGKPFVVISGISFSRKDPTKAEIPYAVELLELFIRHHKDKLDKFINAYTNFHSKKVVNHTYTDLENGTGFIWQNVQYDKPIKYYFTYSDSVFKYSNKSGKVLIENVSSEFDGAIAKAAEHIANTADIAKLKTHLKNYEEYLQEEEALNKLKADLNSCDI